MEQPTLFKPSTMKGVDNMSLIRYCVEFHSLSSKDRQKLFEQVGSIADIGLNVHEDPYSGVFYLNSEDELKLIDFPDGCHVKKL